MRDSRVPDDWDMYWRTCAVCGARYHASDGGCGCEDYFAELPRCECGECDWAIEEDEYGRPPQWQGSVHCQTCGTKPGSGEGTQ